MSEKKEAKEVIINRLFNSLKGQANFIKDDSLNIYEKAKQMDVVLNTMKFLQEYDENVEVLDRYWKDKHFKEKFSRGSDNYK